MSNNPQQEYDDLIAFARSQNRKKTKRTDPNFIYYEKHHIIPDCFYIENRSKGKRPGHLEGNSNAKENLVLLTGREHFEAHVLLIDIYPDHIGVALAIQKMLSESENQVRDAGDYERVKIKVAEAISRQNTGRKLGPQSEEHKKNRKAAGYPKQTEEANQKRRDKLKGVPKSEETKARMKAAALLKPPPAPVSDATRAKQSATRRGVPKSAEHKKKIGIANKGKKKFNPQSKKFLCVETGEIFNSCTEAAKFAGIKFAGDISVIANNVKIGKTNGRQIAGGYHWVYA